MNSAGSSFEARVFDLPCVATSFSGSHEQLDGKENCFVVDMDNDEITNAIVEVFEVIKP